MTKKSNIKFTKPNPALDGEDVALLEAMERGDVPLKRVDDFEEHAAAVKRAAANYFAKDKRVSFRISSADLNNLKHMAAKEGLPYQTYLTSIIHKWTTGQITASDV